MLRMNFFIFVTVYRMFKYPPALMNKRIFAVSIFALLVVSLTGVYFGLYKNKNPEAPGKKERTETPSPEPELRYGMILDSLEVNKYTVVPNETFGAILGKYNIPHEQIHEITTLSDSIYDFSRIRAGKPYTVYCKKDSSNALKCFVYEASALDHYVIKFDSTIEIFKEQKKVDTTVKSMGGVITSSLYETLMENDASPELAVKLADVFAWQVDFFRIMKGDNFRVIYEELSVDGEPIEVGRILAATFEQNDTEYTAFKFKQDDKEEFFDKEGENVQGFFLRAPLKYYRVTSRYTKRRYHPVLKRYKSHLGTDYAAPRGTPILATGKGKVVEAGYTRGNGNYVKIRHNSTYSTQYLHMTRFARGIRRGVYVNQGQVIGYVGSTGLATGPHVCYRFWKNGRQVDPRYVKYTESDPVKEENRKAFEEYRDKMLEKLNAVPLKDKENLLSKVN